MSVIDEKALMLRAFNDEIWTVDISTAKIDLEEKLIDEGDIAIAGAETGDHQFKAVSIAPFD